MAKRFLSAYRNPCVSHRLHVVLREPVRCWSTIASIDGLYVVLREKRLVQQQIEEYTIVKDRNIKRQEVQDNGAFKYN